MIMAYYKPLLTYGANALGYAAGYMLGGPYTAGQFPLTKAAVAAAAHIGKQVPLVPFVSLASRILLFGVAASSAYSAWNDMVLTAPLVGWIKPAAEASIAYTAFMDAFRSD